MTFFPLPDLSDLMNLSGLMVLGRSGCLYERLPELTVKEANVHRCAI